MRNDPFRSHRRCHTDAITLAKRLGMRGFAATLAGLANFELRRDKARQRMTSEVRAKTPDLKLIGNLCRIGVRSALDQWAVPLVHEQPNIGSFASLSGSALTKLQSGRYCEAQEALWMLSRLPRNCAGLTEVSQEMCTQIIHAWMYCDETAARNLIPHIGTLLINRPWFTEPLIEALGVQTLIAPVGRYEHAVEFWYIVEKNRQDPTNVVNRRCSGIPDELRLAFAFGWVKAMSSDELSKIMQGNLSMTA